MEQDLAEGKIIRSHKQNTSEKWMFLTPMVNTVFNDFTDAFQTLLKVSIHGYVWAYLPVSY